MGWLYAWFVATAPRSWVAHGLAALLFAAAATAITHFINPAIKIWIFVIAATVAALFYSAKEMRDELKYRRSRTWTKPRWSTITPRQDQVGDLVGPWCVAATAWLFALLLYV